MPNYESHSGAIQLRAWLIYAAMLAAAIGLFFVIRAWGMGLELPGVAGSAGEMGVAAPDQSGAIVHVLIALTAVLILGRLLAVLFRFVGQPPVIGEIVAGILAIDVDWANGFESAAFRKIHRNLHGPRVIDCGFAASGASFDVFAEDGAYTLGPKNNALAFFVFRLLAKLQSLATVPAVDWMAYANQLSQNQKRRT